MKTNDLSRESTFRTWFGNGGPLKNLLRFWFCEGKNWLKSVSERES